MAQEVTFQTLGDNVAVDINPETAEKYRQELEYVAQTSDIDLTLQYGRFLVVTPEGPDVLEAKDFHEIWAFYMPDVASRIILRAVIRR